MKNPSEKNLYFVDSKILTEAGPETNKNYNLTEKKTKKNKQTNGNEL